MNESPVENLTFEQAFAELEQIVHDLEDGQISLENALNRYEKGVGLLKRCYAQLQQAEQRIQLLLGVSADGQAALQPFEAPLSKEGNEAKKQQKKVTDTNNLF
jgi:exodeoxyribonuclease VII small subunit